MKNITAQFAAKLQGELTAVSTCWTILRRDGAVYSFTDWDVDMMALPTVRVAAESWLPNYVSTYGQQRYIASSGFSKSNLAEVADLGRAGNIQLDGAVDSAIITDASIRNRLWDYAIVMITMVHWPEMIGGGFGASTGDMRVFTGQFGPVTLKEFGWSVELRSLAEFLNREIGDLYSPTCRVDLGSPKCGIDLAPLTVDGTVISSDGFRNLNVTTGAPIAPQPPPGGGLSGIQFVGPVTANFYRHQSHFAGQCELRNAADWDGGDQNYNPGGSLYPLLASVQGNSLLFNPPGPANPANVFANADLSPLIWAVVDSNGSWGTATGPQSGSVNFVPTWVGATAGYTMVVTCTLSFGSSGHHAVRIVHDDGMFWGMGNGATRVSGSQDCPAPFATKTPLMGHNVMGAKNESGGWDLSYVVNIPATGSYPMEIAFTNWQGGQTVQVYIDGVTPHGQFVDVTHQASVPNTTFFDGGLLTWISGANAGYSIDVKSLSSSGSIGNPFVANIASINARSAGELFVFVDSLNGITAGQVVTIAGSSIAGLNGLSFPVLSTGVDLTGIYVILGPYTGIQFGLRSSTGTITAPAQTGGNMSLFSKATYAIQPGDKFKLSPGCDKLFSTCKNKFFNQINFQGENSVPSPDHILDYPDVKIHA